jgi:hypothetical protein
MNPKKFPSLTKVLAAEKNPFKEPFELTRKVDAFIARFKQGGVIELLPEVDENGEKQAKLKSAAAQKLVSTQKLFGSRKYANERLEEAKLALAENTKTYLKKYAGKKANKFEVKVIEDDRQDYYALKVELKYDGQEETLEPANLFYQYDSNTQVAEYADHGSYGKNEPNWAAWLGMDDSPFGSTEFCDDYEYDQMTIAMDQFCATLDESMYPHDLEDTVKKMLAEPEAE